MKNIVRLTESQLKRIISESVKNIISEAMKTNNVKEGKVTNNIPFSLGVRKGKYDICAFSDEDAQNIKNFIKTLPIEQQKECQPFLTYLERSLNGASDVHNKRCSKYDSNGNPLFGREWETSQYVNDKKWREEQLRRRHAEIHPDDLAWDRFMADKTWN